MLIIQKFSLKKTKNKLKPNQKKVVNNICIKFLSLLISLLDFRLSIIILINFFN